MIERVKDRLGQQETSGALIQYPWYFEALENS